MLGDRRLAYFWRNKTAWVSTDTAAKCAGGTQLISKNKRSPQILKSITKHSTNLVKDEISPSPLCILHHSCITKSAQNTDSLKQRTKNPSKRELRVSTEQNN
jgi:hypothetical protein